MTHFTSLLLASLALSTAACSTSPDGDAAGTTSGGSLVGSAEVVTLLPAGDAVMAMAVKGDTLFWIDQAGGVSSAPTAGGDITTLAEVAPFPTSFALFGDDLYVAGAGLYKIPSTGGDPALVDDGSALFVAADASGVYWTDSTGVWKLAAGSPTPAKLLTPENEPLELAVGASKIAFCTDADGAIEGANLDGSNASLLNDGVDYAIGNVLIAGDAVFVTSFLGGGPNGSLLSVPLDGSPEESFTDAASLAAVGLTADEANLYLGSDFGTVITKRPLNGAPETTLLDMQRGTPILAMAVDETSVYFAGGFPTLGIAKVAKE